MKLYIGWSPFIIGASVNSVEPWNIDNTSSMLGFYAYKSRRGQRVLRVDDVRHDEVIAKRINHQGGEHGQG